jgi:hypothetical protein
MKSPDISGATDLFQHAQGHSHFSAGRCIGRSSPLLWTALRLPLENTGVSCDDMQSQAVDAELSHRGLGIQRCEIDFSALALA